MQLISSICEIESAPTTHDGNLLPNVNEVITFTVKQAKTNIFAWKSHILRNIQILDESSVLVVHDWTMKYRESQTD